MGMEYAGSPYRYRDLNSAASSRCEKIIGRIKSAIPFEHILISGLDVDGLRAGSGTLLVSSFPDPYLQTYFSSGALLLDPIIPLALSTDRPVTDGEAWRDKKTGKGLRDLRNLMLHYGIHERTVVPISRSGRTYGAIVVTSKQALTESEQDYLQFVAEPLHAISSEPFADEVKEKLRLTRGELQCLTLASQGKTSETIAQQATFSFETVNTYLKSATKKLGASNRTEAIAEALRRKLIS